MARIALLECASSQEDKGPEFVVNEASFDLLIRLAFLLEEEEV